MQNASIATSVASVTFSSNSFLSSLPFLVSWWLGSKTICIRLGIKTFARIEQRPRTAPVLISEAPASLGPSHHRLGGLITKCLHPRVFPGKKAGRCEHSPRGHWFDVGRRRGSLPPSPNFFGLKTGMAQFKHDVGAQRDILHEPSTLGIRRCGTTRCWYLRH